MSQKDGQEGTLEATLPIMIYKSGSAVTRRVKEKFGCLFSEEMRKEVGYRYTTAII